jgi:ankyrin repeat protein
MELSSENSLFLSSCNNGHLKVAQLLWSIGSSTIDIHANGEYAFRWSCMRGHLEVAQWLWSISNETINIHVCADWVCKMSYKKGCLQMDQWFWCVRNKMFWYQEEDSFIRYQDGQLHVAQWLSCISNKQLDNIISKNRYYYQNSKETITIHYMKHYFYKPHTGPGYLCAIRED